MRDALDVLNAVAPIIMLIVTTAISVLGFFAKRVLDGYTDKLKQFGDTVERVQSDQRALEVKFLEFQVQLPRLFVLKDDHIRHVTILEKKIDDMRDSVGSQLGQLNSDVKLILRDLPKRSADGKS